MTSAASISSSGIDDAVKAANTRKMRAVQVRAMGKHTPPSMNRLSKAILNSNKYSFSSFRVYSLNSLPLEILHKHLQNDPQIVSHTPKMTAENSLRNSLNRLFIE